MRTKVIAISSAMSVLFAIGILLTSCGSNNSNLEYILEGARDNGLVTSYRAYFAIENGSVIKISKTKYENCIRHDENNHYKIVPQECYYFEVNAEDSDPSKWVYEQKYSENSTYDTGTLIEQLSMMDINYSENIDIQIIEFDDYYLIATTNLDGNNTVITSEYAIFHNDEKLSMDEGIDLNSIRNIYKYYE